MKTSYKLNLKRLQPVALPLLSSKCSQINLEVTHIKFREYVLPKWSQTPSDSRFLFRTELDTVIFRSSAPANTQKLSDAVDALWSMLHLSQRWFLDLFLKLCCQHLQWPHHRMIFTAPDRAPTWCSSNLPLLLVVWRKRCPWSRGSKDLKACTSFQVEERRYEHPIIVP